MNHEIRLFWNRPSFLAFSKMKRSNQSPHQFLGQIINCRKSTVVAHSRCARVSESPKALVFFASLFFNFGSLLSNRTPLPPKSQSLVCMASTGSDCKVHGECAQKGCGILIVRILNPRLITAAPIRCNCCRHVPVAQSSCLDNS